MGRRNWRHLLLPAGASLLLLLGGCAPRRPAGPTPTPPSAAKGLFADVAAQAGIDYEWKIAGQRPMTILPGMGNGAAFLDFDNDGILDILLVGPRLALYKGDGHGHFTNVSQAAGLDRLHGDFRGCAVGDYDNDGFEDIYVIAYRGGLLLHNGGGRSFQDVTATAGLRAQPWGSAAAFADIDGDGRLDLYVGDYARFGPETRPQLCRTNDILTACPPQTYPPEKGVLYRNRGGGPFVDATAGWGAGQVSGKTLGAAFADFDGAGKPSLFLANDEMPANLLKNTGKRFQDVGESTGVAFSGAGRLQGGMGADWGDYDNDGRLDLAVATFSHEIKPIYHNEAGGAFTDQSTALGLADAAMANVAFGIKWLDYDNDGWLDLVIANGHTSDNVAETNPGLTYRQTSQLFHNDHGTHLTPVTDAGEAFARPIVGRGLAVGDYDNDGRPDLLIVDSEGKPLLLHNETPNAGHWLSLTLVGRKCNRDGIGAEVIARTPGLVQHRFCHTDGSYLSASDRRVLIGLGKATQADLTVRWPDGRTATLRNVAADRQVAVKE